LEDAQRRREIRKLAAMPANPVTAMAEVPPPSRESPAPVAAAAASPSGDEALCAAVLAELRINIRGRAAPDLARILGASPERVEEACALLSARGQAVRRGLKYFVA
ncbi:MAG TPA: hypothetical protein VIG99_30800, partial [Myxococcaceae bacterium]